MTLRYTANSLNQYSALGAASPTYDGNGNLTGDGTLTYAYDAESRLTSVKQGAATLGSYAFDAQGRRKSKTVGTATTIYVTDADNREVLEYDGASGAIQAWYAFALGPDAVLNRMNVAAASRQTMIPDIQGSIIATLDSGTGALIKTGYQPYGENTAATTGSYRYTGRRIDPEAAAASQPSALYHYRAREYSPTWGRFLQPDPIGYSGGGNLYAYVANDPLNLLDFSGLYAQVVVNGNQVVITVPIQFVGSGATPERVAAIAAATQRDWSGVIGGYNVTTKVVTPSPGAIATETNTITVLDQPGVSVTNGVGGNASTVYTSYPGYPAYSESQLGATSAHEIGHQMGDIDFYTSETIGGITVSKPNPGFENNLMGTIAGSVDSRNIKDVISCSIMN